MTQVNPLTGNKYTFDEAFQKFAEEDPTHIMDIAAHSMAPIAPYSETTSAVNLLTNHPNVVDKYKTASAYLIDRNANYSPLAYQLETSLGSRQKDTPQQYLDSLLVATGNDWYYNYLTLQNGITNIDQATGAQRNALHEDAINFGKTFNPTWYNSHYGLTNINHEITAIKEMTQLVKDPSVPASVLDATEKGKFADLLNQYNGVLKSYQGLMSAGDKSDASLLLHSWSDWCTNNATDPYYAKQAFFMTGVLKNLPSR